MKSIAGKSNKAVGDQNLRRLLNDPSMSESDRLSQIRIRTEQIEQRARMEEEKLRLIKPKDKKVPNDYNIIEQNLAVNDIYIDSI